jgi:hypothetical protein
MSVYRIYPSKSNTIASGSAFEYINSSQNPVSDIFYGGGFTENGVYRENNISRLLLYFDLSNLVTKFSDLTINSGTVQSFRIVLKNSVPSDKILIPEYQNATLNKAISASFDLISFPIDKDWDEGRGYDLFDTNYLIKSAGNLRLTGNSNWIYAKSNDSWNEPGIYNNPTASTTYYSTQHFQLGSEDISMDVTNIVNDWLSGGSINYGLAVSYSRPYELESGDTRNIASFFTQKTNSSFKPYLEVTYNQTINDDRNIVTNNRPCRLFLYTFSGNQATNFYSSSTVSIKTMSNANVFTGLVPQQLSKGVYYVDVWMSGATPGQRYKDVWQGVTFQPGYDQTDFIQFFDINQNYYTNNSKSINDYVVTTYGLNNNDTLQTDELIRIYADTRVNYTLKSPKTNFGLEYRLSMNNVIEIIPWTPCNSAIIDGCAKSFLDLDTSWLLSNQNYQITFRINELGTRRIIAEKLNFKIVDKLYPQDY